MTNDVRNLLGGYATGTLTEAEQKQLFEAALHDESLFAALADEEALRELLSNPAAKEKLLRTAEGAAKKKLQWSVPIAIAAMLVITVGVGMVWLQLNPPAREVAMSVPRPAVSEPARPELERQSPRKFETPTATAPSQRTPSIPPPPAAIAVSTPRPRLQVVLPPPAALPSAAESAIVAQSPAANKSPAANQASAVNTEREQKASADMAMSAAKPAGPKAEARALAKTAVERVQRRIVEEPSGTRVILTPAEDGTLVVVANTGSVSRIILNSEASAGVEQTTPTLSADINELIVTLNPSLSAAETRFAPRSAARQQIEQPQRRSFTLRIPIAKKK